MKEVGRKTDYRTHPLQSVNIQKNFDGLATAFPRIPEDHKLLCVFDTWGSGDGTEKMYMCDTIEDINLLLQRYNSGMALQISFVTVAKAHFEIEKIMSPEDLVNLMRSSASEEEFNRNVKIVKARFNGDYPPFWFGTMVVSGVTNEIQRTWSKPSATAVSSRLSFIATSHKESSDDDIESENEDTVTSVASASRK